VRERLVRSDLNRPGITRRRCGRGHRYLTPGGQPASADERARARALVIPPAWADVWICPEPSGHIQAAGTDDAGRRQYIYHQLWREQQDRAKHARLLRFGAALPRIRAVVEHHLSERGLGRERVLSAAIRLIDLGFFRPGGEEYAEENATFGLATIRRDHVTCSRGEIVFDYVGKGSQRREHAIADARTCSVVKSLKNRRWGGAELLAYRAGSQVHDVTAADINAYLQEISGADFTVKDFRTWHATVLAAVGLAVSAAAPERGRGRAAARVAQEVAGYLGNTPAVARSAYIDPVVFARYQAGRTIAKALDELGADAEYGELATQGHVESAVLRLLKRRAPAGRGPSLRPGRQGRSAP
jgi:DNA topoisomerase IB